LAFDRKTALLLAALAGTSCGRGLSRVLTLPDSDGGGGEEIGSGGGGSGGGGSGDGGSGGGAGGSGGGSGGSGGGEAGGDDGPGAAPEGGDGIEADAAMDDGQDVSTVVFHPEGLPRSASHLVLWLDPTQGLLTDPSFRWVDRSPAHNDASAAAASSPAVLPAQGGLPPMLDFSGGQYLSLPQSQTDFNSGVSIFVVAEPAPPNPMFFLDFSLDYGVAFASSQATLRFGVDPLYLLYEVKFAGFLPAVLAAVSDNYSLQLFEVVSLVLSEAEGSTGFAYEYKNGVDAGAQGTMQTPGTVIRHSNLIGRSNAEDTPDFAGKLCEVIVYAINLRDDERLVVENYLMTRWHLR
jgi:hypothetical protein